ncbi:nucleoside-diphosphate sugar epimerase/dehydratase [Marinilactibacillus sp. XAAS-LB27]|uniref:polysaccharide biosynthesis protein n=1 Tax=Marinilactibacillus sp. XAAS-LB27 TaxID=3114538 RepID=UPI002E18BAB1|nr:nucleoside-diphosphate sugar epimerase/dehydratase [Marinilactibacillus sp. XAAS-LB27]
MMTRSLKRLVLGAVDALFMLFSSMFAYIFLIPFLSLSQQSYAIVTLLMLVTYIIIALKTRTFDKINRFTSINEIINHAKVITISYLISSVVSLIIYQGFSYRFLFMSYIVAATLIIGSRVFWRIYIEHRKKLQLRRDPIEMERFRTLIIGAGEGGSLFIKHIHKNPAIEIIGLIDDDKNKYNTLLYGVPILGDTSQLKEIIYEYDIDQVTLAIPSLNSKKIEEIIDLLTDLKVKINQMPSVEEIVTGSYEVNKFKEIDVVDLLGREEVKLDIELLSEKLSSQTILISGAGGSIGSEICRQIIRFTPKRIILLGHGENSIYLINKELSKYDAGSEIISVIADIQDRNRIIEVMQKYKPDQIYHAAAHKHVPLMESNPVEAVKNNIFGTKNMAEAAKMVGVSSFVMISTDKAVNPPNVMGATKRIAEMIVTGLNEKNNTKFVAVRFGNVLGSRGSVIPLFKEQISMGGPITITDFRMTRYFMTIPEASKLVLQAGSLAKGGEIFVLDMNQPVKIVDLAKKMIKLSGYTEKDIQIKEVGIRPGEKLFEELMTSDEHTGSQVYDKIFVGNVTNKPYDDVVNFVNNIIFSESDDLKEKLLRYANDKNYRSLDKAKDEPILYFNR